MSLEQLPQFTLDEIRGPRREGELQLIGRLSHRRGVRNCGGALYAGEASVLGRFDTLPAPGEHATLHALAWAALPPLVIGQSLPWLDEYWQPYQLMMILDPAHQWRGIPFVAEPAQYFDLNGVTGWQKAGEPLPAGARALEVRADAWDHEHCDLCHATIGARGTPIGYVDPEDRWLCPECYTRYAATHDVAFAADA